MLNFSLLTYKNILSLLLIVQDFKRQQIFVYDTHLTFALSCQNISLHYLKLSIPSDEKGEKVLSHLSKM